PARGAARCRRRKSGAPEGRVRSIRMPVQTNVSGAERALRRRLAELGERFREHGALIAELERFERGEPELEERAQETDLASELATLEDRDQIELRNVIAALRKLRDGGYGTCERCGGAI